MSTAAAVLTVPSRWRKSLRMFARSKGAWFGLAVVTLLVAAALLAPVLAPYDPAIQDLGNQNQPPGPGHWLGTDRFGRDIFSRIIWGARLSLVTGLGSVLLGAVLGALLGLGSGYYRGWLDTVIIRVVDLLLVFPLYLTAIFVVAVLGPSILNTVLAVGIATTPTFARLTRGEVLGEREREYVLAARAIGSSPTRVIVRHILPNILAPMLVLGSLNIGNAVLVEASLSFLGLGPAPPTPSWGLMVNDGMVVLLRAPWVSLIPGAAIALLVLGANLLGDGLRDVLDPRLRGSL